MITFIYFIIASVFLVILSTDCNPIKHTFMMLCIRALLWPIGIPYFYFKEL